MAHAALPPCGEDEALFAADELLKSGVTLEDLLNAQGLDPAPLTLLKYSPDQPRVPAGNGRESGQWPSNGEGQSKGPLSAPSSDATRSESDVVTASDSGPPTGSGTAIEAPQALTPDIAAPVQLAQNVTCSAFIAENCKGSILRDFPSEYLDVTIKS